MRIDVKTRRLDTRRLSHLATRALTPSAGPGSTPVYSFSAPRTLRVAPPSSSDLFARFAVSLVSLVGCSGRFSTLPVGLTKFGASKIVATRSSAALRVPCRAVRLSDDWCVEPGVLRVFRIPTAFLPSTEAGAHRVPGPTAASQRIVGHRSQRAGRGAHSGGRKARPRPSPTRPSRQPEAKAAARLPWVSYAAGGPETFGRD